MNKEQLEDLQAIINGYVQKLVMRSAAFEITLRQVYERLEELRAWKNAAR